MTASTHRGTCLPRPASLPARGRCGYSVTELVVTICIMGVLAGVAVGPLNQQLDGARDAVAAARQEMLNQALHGFAQHNYELLFSAIDAATADEMVVLRTLQYRDPNPNRSKIGSPYLDPRYNPVASSSAAQYRLRWNGKMYELLKPGQAGTGLLMNFDGTDFTTAFVFPPNFKMAGR